MDLITVILDLITTRIELVLLVVVIGGMYAYTIIKDLEKTKLAVIKTFKVMISTFPFLIAALMLVGLFKILLEPQLVVDLLGEQQGIMALVIATFIGFPLPGPRYAVYPLARQLYDYGASVGVVAAIICGQQIIDVPDGFILEIKLLGWRFFAIRTVIAVIVVFLEGLLVSIVFIFLPHGIN
jgi:uncharacterized membrane protein YraQ (UPF0718 family)